MRPLITLQIGGGIGSLIGQTHRIAMQMDRRFDLVGGIFNSSHEKSLQMAEQLGLQPNRTYSDFDTLIEGENRLGEDKADCISICTPNETHFSYCKAALNAGFHVVCDKPIAGTVQEAEELEKIAADKGLILAVTYNYSGYPMVREARERILAGEIGRPYIVNVEMPQAAVSKLKASGEIEPRMRWRLDLAKSGGSLVLLDLMTHVVQMAEYVSGQKIEKLSADCQAINNAHGVDDNAVLSCKFDKGAIGQLWASFVATGTEQGLSFQIFGEQGSLHWKQ
ncbi:MAG: Gfo/Idh/MocA family protein, partial [Alphaproteobacteria bacterium]